MRKLKLTKKTLNNRSVNYWKTVLKNRKLSNKETDIILDYIKKEKKKNKKMAKQLVKNKIFNKVAEIYLRNTEPNYPLEELEYLSKEKGLIKMCYLLVSAWTTLIKAEKNYQTVLDKYCKNKLSGKPYNSKRRSVNDYRTI